MKKFVLTFFGLVILALPQIASAQNFAAANAYAAKFLCGLASGGESGLGVVLGHYNTTINVLATKSKQPIAYRATATRNNLGVGNPTVSNFSARFERDRDEALGIVCSQIKSLLEVGGVEGFIEGFLIIYSNGPLLVTDVLTGEGDTEAGLSAMQVFQVIERTISNFTVKPLN